jgi:uncharacterized membrane protein
LSPEGEHSSATRETRSNSRKHEGTIPRVAVAATLALLLLELLWELVLAPLGGHPSWLALKALPLAVLLPGTARGALRSRQWLALLLPFYAAEALTRASVEPGRHALVAGVACATATVAFVALLAWFRRSAARGEPHREHDPLDDA